MRSSPAWNLDRGASTMSLPEAELARIRAQAPVPEAWLVGGTLRDLLQRRAVTDIDLVVDADAGAVARELARVVGGSPFPLSERHGAWRVGTDETTVDIAACRGSIRRGHGQARLHDQRDGASAWTAASWSIRSAVAPTSKPEFCGLSPRACLTTIRCGCCVSRRLAHELDFEIDEDTAKRARARAGAGGRPRG